MKNKAIICLAAGRSQLLIINKAKELGFSVIAIDQRQDAPGFKVCEEKIVLSTYEAGPIIKALDKIGSKYQIIGVINRSSGKPVITASEICAHLGIACYPSNSAHIAIDKNSLMKLCNKTGIDVPKSTSLKTFDEFKRSGIGFPCVIKPSLSFVGKSGVRIVKDEKTLKEALAETRSISMLGIELEEYIEGNDVSLMAVVNNGTLYPIVLLDEINKVDSDGKVKGSGFSCPSIYTGTEAHIKILDSAKKLCSALKIERSAFTLSFRIDASGTPNIIELHLDLGGDLILDALLPNSTKTDVLKEIILTLSGEQAQPKIPSLSPAAVVYIEGLASERLFDILKADHPESLMKKVLERVHLQ